MCWVKNLIYPSPSLHFLSDSCKFVLNVCFCFWTVIFWSVEIQASVGFGYHCEQPKERTTVANETKWCVKTLTERRPRSKKWTLVVKTGGLHEECGMWTMRGRQWPGSHCVGEEVRAFVQQHPKLSSPHPWLSCLSSCFNFIAWNPFSLTISSSPNWVWVLLPI